ncbi:response regulator [Rhodoferax sp. GW822-FHT02A01]|uniref:response regulator n=1 Tax=Rhodoferax sp. GW822-FHT02A01 TaxID=3141537 RepID=UPI00315D4C94
MSLALRQASILIIDDFQGMRTMLREFLSSMGVTAIDTASNGRDALQLLAANRFDIVICDYNLGEGANGQHILEEAKLKNHVGVSTVWVMVTAEKTPEMVMGAAEIRPDDYLLKPISQAMLENRLEKLLARKQSLAPIEASVKALNYADALAQCDQQLKSNAINPHEILRIKSELLLAMGDYAAATALFESVLVTREVPWAQTGLGKVYFHDKKYAQAREMFQSVLEQNEVFMEASDWLAKTCIMQGDHQTAQTVLQDAARLSPNSPTRQKLLGDTALKNGALDVARSAFEKTIRISEFSPHKSASAYTRLARVLSEQGAPQDALKTLAQSKKEFRYNTEAALQTAAAESVIYQDMGQADRAQAALLETEKLIDKAAGKVGADVALEVADSLFRLGKKDKACSLLKDVVRNNHENQELSNSIAAIFEEHGLVAEGQALIAESRGEVVGINNEGVTLAKQGDLLAGVNRLRTAAEKLPNNEVILINLCGLLIALLSKEGRNHQIAGEVRELLDRVRQLNPSNKNYHVYTAALNRVMGTN